MNNIIKEKIIKEVKLLTQAGECVGIKISNDKGLFIQVDYSLNDNLERVKEYFIELNDVDSDNVYEPCGHYNERVEFGNIELLIDKIEKYLEYHGI